MRSPEESEVAPTTVSLRRSWHVRIVRTPGGEAPLEVREQWVGLVLPTLDREPRTLHTSGVVSGSTTRLGALWQLLTGRMEKTVGHRVPSKVAIELLGRSSPSAARWWTENAPAFLDPGHHFLFPSVCCERTEDEAQEMDVGAALRSTGQPRAD